MPHRLGDADAGEDKFQPKERDQDEANRLWAEKYEIKW